LGANADPGEYQMSEYHEGERDWHYMLSREKNPGGAIISASTVAFKPISKISKKMTIGLYSSMYSV